MRIKIVSLLALGAILSACSCCDTPPAPQIATVTEQRGIDPREDFVRNIGDRVFFKFDSSKLSEASKETIRRQSEWLRKNCEYKVVIVGKCDERGTEEYNLALGERRANAVKKKLIDMGISPDRISSCSKGKSEPEVIGNTEEVYAKNRVSITVLMDGCSESTTVLAPSVTPEIAPAPIA